MWTIFWRSLKDRRLLLLIYCLVSIGLLFVYIGLFPSFKDQSASMEQLIKSYPESFLKAFNFDIKSFTTLEGFLSTEQFSFMWPILAIVMLIGFAGSAFAGEVEKGTIEIILSQPISRMRLFLGRYFAGLTMLILFVLFSVFAAIPLAEIFGIDYHAKNFITIALLSFMFGSAIFSIGMFLTTIFSDKGKVFFISGGILVLMYVLNIVSAIKESLSDLKYLSFFYYFNPQKALVYNEIDNWSYLIFIGLTIILTSMALLIINRRDVAA